MREKDDGDGWKVREIIVPDTGARYTQYFYKRRRALRIELTDKVSAQLAAYTLIEKDLRNVLSWLNEIETLHTEREGKRGTIMSQNREIYDVIKGLYVASLSFYGKCFTSCVGRRVKLEKSNLDEEYKDIHDAVMHMRHNYAAHSGADNFEEVKIALVLPSNKNHLERLKIYRELMQPDLVEVRKNGLTFVDLAKHVQNKVLDKIDSLQNRILEKEVLPKGPQYWYKKGK